MKIQLQLIVLSVIGAGLTSSAQSLDSSRTYDGPQIGFGRPTPLDTFRGCDAYLNDAARKYAACQMGQQEAERLAQQVAAQQGRIQGYLKGYAWGLHQGEQQTQNDPAAFAAGQQLGSTTLDASMQPGLAAATNSGNSTGSSQGNSDSIGRFESAVNTGTVPPATLQIPTSAYTVEANPYLHYVGAVPNPSDILRNEFGSAQINIFNGWDNSYGNQKQFQPADLYTRDGSYEYDRDRFLDGGQALNLFKSRPSESLNRYQGLNNPPFYQTENGSSGESHSHTFAAAGGAPAGAPGGHGTPGVHPSPSPTAPAPSIHPVTPPAPVQIAPPVVVVPPPPVMVMVDLHPIFDAAFMAAYTSRADSEYSKSFYETLDQGENDGVQLGMQLGSRESQYQGQMQAYNLKFAAAAGSAYQTNFSSSYTQSFQSTYQDYLTHPQLTITLDSMSNEAEGILDPGAPFSIKFSVRNAGGVSSGLQAMVSGSVTNNQIESFNIGALSTASFDAKSIGNVEADLSNGSPVNVTLEINGIEAMGSGVAHHSLAIQNSIPTINYLNGSGEIKVTVGNITPVRASGNAVATLLLDGQSVMDQQVGILEGNTTKDVVFDFGSIDPLSLINDTHSAQVIVKIGTVQMDQIQIGLSPADKRPPLASYFNELVNGRGIAPASSNLSARITTVRTLLETINDQEIQDNRSTDGNDPWNDSASTILALLANQYRSSPQSDAAKKSYDQVAHDMFSHSGRFAKFLFGKTSDKQKAYEALCHEFATSRL